MKNENAQTNQPIAHHFIFPLAMPKHRMLIAKAAIAPSSESTNPHWLVTL